MNTNRENLWLSLHDVNTTAQQATLIPNSSTTNNLIHPTNNPISSLSTTTATSIANNTNTFNTKFAISNNNDKCERLRKMQSIQCSDSEDDSERRSLIESNKWNHSGIYSSVSWLFFSRNIWFSIFFNIFLIFKKNRIQEHMWFRKSFGTNRTMWSLYKQW